MQKLILIIAFAFTGSIFCTCKKKETIHLAVGINDTLKAVLKYTMPVNNIPGWKQILAEDFLLSATPDQFSAVYNQSWAPYDNGGKYYQSAISASNGMMTITLNGRTGAAGVFGPSATR